MPFPIRRLCIPALLLALTCTGCGPRQQQLQEEKPQELPADDSYEQVLNRLISRKEVHFSSAPVEAGTGYDYPGEDGYQPSRTRYFFFGKTRFPMKQIDVIGEADSLRYQQLRFETDTAALFAYKGKSYGWAKAYMYGCNGTGCEEEFHFIADMQNGRLHAFSLRSVPSYRWYFGDLDGDDEPDVILPRRISNRRMGSDASGDTVMLVLYAYQLKGKNLIPLTDHDKEPCFWILRFDNGYYAPRNCSVIATTF